MKTIFIAFFDVRGMIKKEFVPLGTIINWILQDRQKVACKNQPRETWDEKEWWLWMIFDPF